MVVLEGVLEVVVVVQLGDQSVFCVDLRLAE